MDQFLNRLYMVSLVVGMCTITLVWLGPPFYSYPATNEDRAIENLSALFYFLGVAVCIYMIVNQTATGFVYLWLVLCIIFLGEETSWFQRVFNYSIPFIENQNAQGEFNIHNLRVWSGQKFVDQKGNWQFNLATFFTSQNIFRLGLLTYFFLLPLLYRWHKTRYFLDQLNFPSPPILLLWALWSTVLFSVLLAFVSAPLAKDALAETREMFYAYFIFLYLLSLALIRRHIATVPDDTEST